MFQLECSEGSCKGDLHAATPVSAARGPTQESSRTAIGEASSVGIMASNREVWNANETAKRDHHDEPPMRGMLAPILSSCEGPA